MEKEQRENHICECKCNISCKQRWIHYQKNTIALEQDLTQLLAFYWQLKDTRIENKNIAVKSSQQDLKACWLLFGQGGKHES